MALPRTQSALFGLAALMLMSACSPALPPKEKDLEVCLSDKLGPRWSYYLPNYTRLVHQEWLGADKFKLLDISFLSEDVTAITRMENGFWGDDGKILETRTLDQLTPSEKKQVEIVRACAQKAGIGM